MHGAPPIPFLAMKQSIIKSFTVTKMAGNWRKEMCSHFRDYIGMWHQTWRIKWCYYRSLASKWFQNSNMILNCAHFWNTFFCLYSVVTKCGSYVPNFETIWTWCTQFWNMLCWRKARWNWHFLWHIVMHWFFLGSDCVHVFDILHKHGTHNWNKTSV